MLNKEILPIRGFIGASIYATFLICLLVLIGHPINELAVTAAVFYLFVWLMGEGLTRLSLKVLQGLIRYGEAVARRLGNGSEEIARQSSGGTFVGNILALIMVGLLGSAIFGGGLVLGRFAVEAVGLSHLPGYFSWIALSLAAAGGNRFVLRVGSHSLVVSHHG